MKKEIEKLKEGCGKLFEYERKGIHITGACGDTGYTDGFIPLCPVCKAKLEQEHEFELLKKMGTDGGKWAEEFIKLFEHKKEKIDEGLMIGWFCNSIMAGYDKAKLEQAQKDEKKIGIIKERLKDRIKEKSEYPKTITWVEVFEEIDKVFSEVLG